MTDTAITLESRPFKTAPGYMSGGSITLVNVDGLALRVCRREPGDVFSVFRGPEGRYYVSQANNDTEAGGRCVCLYGFSPTGRPLSGSRWPGHAASVLFSEDISQAVGICSDVFFSLSAADAVALWAHQWGYLPEDDDDCCDGWADHKIRSAESGWG